MSHGISVVFPRMQRCRQQQCTSPSVQSACSNSSFLSAGVPPHPVAAWPTWPRPFRPGSGYCANRVLPLLPPPAVAAGPAASWRGGRCHVSPAAPAATAEGVLFVKFIGRWSFLSIHSPRWSFSTKNLIWPTKRCGVLCCPMRSKTHVFRCFHI